MTGNIFAENDTFKFNRQEDENVKFKGHGLFQFTDYKDKETGNIVGHRTEYFNYIKQNNKEDNINSQIDYVLDGIFKGKGHNIGAGNIEKLKDAFDVDDVKDITKIFMKVYENPKSGESLAKRIAFANKLFVDKD